LAIEVTLFEKRLANKRIFKNPPALKGLMFLDVLTLCFL